MCKFIKVYKLLINCKKKKLFDWCDWSFMKCNNNEFFFRRKYRLDLKVMFKLLCIWLMYCFRLFDDYKLLFVCLLVCNFRFYGYY